MLTICLGGMGLVITRMSSWMTACVCEMAFSFQGMGRQV